MAEALAAAAAAAIFHAGPPTVWTATVALAIGDRLLKAAVRRFTASLEWDGLIGGTVILKRMTVGVVGDVGDA